MAKKLPVPFCSPTTTQPIAPDMRYFLLLACLYFAAACRQTAPTQPIGFNEQEPAAPVTYGKEDMRKMDWLIGEWIAADANAAQESVRMVNDSTIEIRHFAGTGREETIQRLSWDHNRFVLGDDWAVSWIGRKTVRLDPIRPGLPPLTWTRRSEDAWFSIRHEARPNQVLMRRVQRVSDVEYP